MQFTIVQFTSVQFASVQFTKRGTKIRLAACVLHLREGTCVPLDQAAH